MKIEEDIEYQLKKQPKTYIRFRRELEELGIKNIVSNVNLKSEVYYKELTLIESLSNCETKIVHKTLREELSKLKGFSYENLHYISVPEGCIPIKVRSLELGFYNKKKNYIAFFYNFLTRTEFKLGEKNEVVDFFIDLIKELNEKEKLETVDVKEIEEQIVAEIFNKHWKEEKERNEKDITRTFDRIETLQKEVVAEYKNIDLRKKQNKTIETNLKKGIDKVGEVIKELRQMRFIKNVKIDMGKIICDFGEIKIKWKDKEVLLGEYLVHFTSDGIKIENKNPIYDGGIKILHPHISGEDGTDICFGSERGVEINKLLSELDYPKLAYMLLLFLKNYNEGDCFNNIEIWTKAKNEGGKRVYGG